MTLQVHASGGRRALPPHCHYDVFQPLAQAAAETHLHSGITGDILSSATNMTDTEKRIEHLEEQIPSLSAVAVGKAYRQALAAGQRVLVSGNDGIYEIGPDGTKKFLKATGRPLSVPVGTRVRIPCP